MWNKSVKMTRRLLSEMIEAIILTVGFTFVSVVVLWILNVLELKILQNKFNVEIYKISF